jgi:dihydroorotase
MRWLLKNGRVIVPGRAIDGRQDILVEDSIVRSLDYRGEPDGAGVIDAGGLIVCPGFIDVHTHLREPGFEHKETIRSGTASAAAGGFTTVCCMPNTDPPIDSASVVHYVQQRAAEAGPVRVLPMGALTRGMGQEQLAELGELAEAGVSAFTDDAFPVQAANLLRSAMQYATSFNLPVVTHCEDKSLTTGASMHEGYYSTILGLKGMPRTAEELQVARNILLAEETGCRLHICHISTRRSVEMVRRARAAGIQVTAEACPHHFSLTDRLISGEEPARWPYDTNAKMNPPLRTDEDVAAVIEGLKDGTISCIATDHAPHSREEKEVEFGLAPFGIVGFETALAVSLTSLVAPGYLSLPDVVRLLTSGAAEVIQSPNAPAGMGDLVDGGRADITVFDADESWVVDAAALHSLSKNTPYDGSRLTGRVRHVMAGGQLVVRDGGLI